MKTFTGADSTLALFKETVVNCDIILTAKINLIPTIVERIFLCRKRK
jgi:hypothetical protein